MSSSTVEMLHSGIYFDVVPGQTYSSGELIASDARFIKLTNEDEHGEVIVIEITMGDDNEGSECVPVRFARLPKTTMIAKTRNLWKKPFPVRQDQRSLVP